MKNLTPVEELSLKHCYPSEQYPNERVVVPIRVKELLTQDRNQAYTSLVEGIEGMKRLCICTNGSCESHLREKYLTDILENVVKPLYGKE